MKYALMNTKNRWFVIERGIGDRYHPLCESSMKYAADKILYALQQVDNAQALLTTQASPSEHAHTQPREIQGKSQTKSRSNRK